ncbi:MAG: protein translocase subunit SecD [Candidatus Goldiibacteriota bacterium HGW-Goldbacteria-1]|jgi:protein-export membrane protein SecD|nr:MAG: protein translocase subunit SecD [Candidatus Goldiibacteriota bacterium HGW-Goldbacteria-1]
MRKIQFVAVLTFALLILSVWQIWPPMDIKDAEGNVTKKGSVKLGLDLQGGMLLKLAVDETKLPENIKLEEAVSRALEILRNRIDALGVAEPLIQREGEKYIVIQLPGIKDTTRALDIIGKTALLEFKLVSERYKVTEMTDADGNIDPDKVPAEVMVLEGKEGERYVIEKKDLITGADLIDAKVQMGQYGEPVVGFKLSPAGGRKFAEITGDNVNRNLAIVLDDKVYSAPVIKSRISGGEGVIEGNFTIDTSRDLALILRAGALPAPVKIVNKQIIGPSMGADAVKKGMTSMFIGALLVLIFMAIYYGMSGIIADFALALNVIFIFGILAALDATLTLPGIAGITLTLGMAVDSNILILERIREELRTGKTIRAAIDAGYNRALWTIIDSHVTSLITAAILFQFGTGPIRGFAVTMFWGITISLFTAFFVTKSVFDLRKNYKTLSI